MSTFFQTFSKILGFLCAFLFFTIILIISLNFYNKSNIDNFNYSEGQKKSENIIGVLYLNGPIISNPINEFNINFFQNFEIITPSKIKKYLLELEEKKISGLIISINSPGGSVSATNEIYNSINSFKLKNNIPIYFHSTNILASGAYWISLAGDKIFASYGSLVGSIGVKGPDWLYYNSPTSFSPGIIGNSIESPNGIELFTNIAGKSKDIFNPFRKPTEFEIIELKKMVEKIYTDFINLVSSKRKIEKEFLTNDIGAMIFDSENAKEKFLIDNEQSFNTTIEFLINNLKIDDFT